jgi:NAD(P)-dependent dehydrogenase (short-subunit alcohol dehydrogenase family)
MAANGSVVVVGGSSGLGLEVARHYAQQGRDVVVTSRDTGRAEAAAKEAGGATVGLALDLAQPERIADSLGDLGQVAHVVISAIDRDENTVRDYNIAGATMLATLKLVGYTEVVHALLSRMGDDSSIVLFGGLAKSRPYPGSTTVTTVNGAISTMIHTMAVELAPIRVNAIHPAIVGDSPYWKDKPAAVLENFRARTPLGRLVSMADVVHATAFLLENPAVTGVNLNVDGGWLLT